MIINIDEQIAIDKWKKLMDTTSNSSVFQSPEFFNFLNSNKDTRAHVVAVKENNDIVALCVIAIYKERGLKSFFSRRGIIYGGPLLSPSYENSIFLLLDAVANIAKGKCIYIESRNLTDYSKVKDIFLKMDWHYQPWMNFQVSLKSRESVVNKISESRWRQISKAKKKGVEWKVADSDEEIGKFYAILCSLYKSKVKKPLPELDFFLNLSRTEICKILLITYNKEVIGGIVCPVLGKNVIYEFYVCGLDLEFKDFYPSAMATWAAIEFGLENQIEVFDFMGAGNPNESYGVREFKARFGGEGVEHGRFLKVLNPFFYYLGKIVIKLKLTQFR